MVDFKYAELGCLQHLKLQPHHVASLMFNVLPAVQFEAKNVTWFRGREEIQTGAATILRLF